MKFVFFAAVLFCVSIRPVSVAGEPAKSPASRERLSLDRGWRFHPGDVPFPVITGHEPSYSNAKAGKAWGAAAPEYDDSDWRVLDLPHDWAVEGPFDEKENLSQGYRARGIGWYRRQFKLDPTDRGRHLELQFDGVATHCEVWLNGTVVARNWCGYTSFYVDLTPFAQFGDSLSTLAIRVDADAMEGWWYEGAGIYRHTWLTKTQRRCTSSPDGVSRRIPCAEPTARWTAACRPRPSTTTGAETQPIEVEVTLTDDRFPSRRSRARAPSSAKVDPLIDETEARLVTSPSPNASFVVRR